MNIDGLQLTDEVDSSYDLEKLLRRQKTFMPRLYNEGDRFEIKCNGEVIFTVDNSEPKNTIEIGTGIAIPGPC